MKNMAYNVIIKPQPQHRLDMYIGYTLHVLKNKQAAKTIRDDAIATKRELAVVAPTLRYCENPVLKKLGYRKIVFRKHDFLMLYRIEDDKIIVDGMYHQLQDYESIFANDMNLD